MTGWMIDCCDALEGLDRMYGKAVDAIVTDPPYGERAARWDKPQPREWWITVFDLARRALKSDGVLITFASRRYLDVVMGAMREVFGDTSERPLQTGAWVHRQGHPTGSDGFVRPEHEPWISTGLLRTRESDVRCCRAYRTAHNIARRPVHANNRKRGFKAHVYVPHEDGPMAGTIIEAARNKPGEATGHPTQKPEFVMKYLVALASAPGDLVLDPFSGSGTTGVVARRLGRRFLGFDSDAGYCEIARRRLTDDAPLFNRIEATA